MLHQNLPPFPGKTHQWSGFLKMENRVAESGGTNGNRNE
jgi:hypothetical protein